MIGGEAVIQETRQLVNYFILPSAQSEELFFNLPEIIHEVFSNWIDKQSSEILYFETKIKKYTFIGAKVKWCKSVVNRYGENSRDMKVSFIEMHFGIKRRK